MSRVLEKEECRLIRDLYCGGDSAATVNSLLDTIDFLRAEVETANKDFEQVHELNSKLIEEKAVIEKRHFTLDDVNNAYLAGQETSDSFEGWLRYYTTEAR